MTPIVEFDRQQLEKLDEEELIDFILTMQKQLVEQSNLIQQLRDQFGKK